MSVRTSFRTAVQVFGRGRYRGRHRRGRGIGLFPKAASAGVAAAAVAASLLGAPPAQGHPGSPSGVFDPNSVGWASIRDHGSSSYGAKITSYRDQGYIALDIDITTDGGYRGSAVFQTNTDHRNWRFRRDLTSAQYHDAWEQAKADGLRPVDQETYVLNGTRRWAGLWVQNKEGYGWASYRSLTDTELNDRTTAARRAGRMPVDVDTYLVNGSRRHNVVYVQNAEGLDWRLRTNLTSAQFSDLFSSYSNSGFRMLGLDSFQTGSGQRYDGLWVFNANGRQWRERRDMTAQSYANWWHRYSDEGFRVITSYRYQTAGGTRYAMILRQNSARPAWSLRSQVNTRIQTELDSHDVPGISVAIIQNGQFRYLRGFGDADVGNHVWMDSDVVQRHGSVSKAVAGTLLMKMIEQGSIDLDDETRDLVPTMPAHHSHTVGQLASNRGCLRHYNEGPSEIDNKQYNTALSASQQFWSDPLVCTVGDYHYSTHGYTLLGAALESAGGQSVQNLVLNKITNPYGLTTLRPENRSDTSVRRTTLYNDDNSKAGPDNISWKVLGGGLESSAADLARFGSKLCAGQILSQDSLDTMWTAPDGEANYGYGWNTGTDNGHRVVAKDGAQLGARSYLRIYPDDGIVIAVLTNRKGGGHDPVDLGRDIGAMMI